MPGEEIIREFFHLASVVDLQLAFSAIVQHHDAYAWVQGLVLQRRKSEAPAAQLFQQVPQPVVASFPASTKEHEADLVKQARTKLQSISRAKYSPRSRNCIRPIEALLDQVSRHSEDGLPFVALQILGSIALAWPKLHEDVGVDDSYGDADMMYFTINSGFATVLAKAIEVGVDKNRKAVLSKARSDYEDMCATWCRYGGRLDKATVALFDKAVASVTASKRPSDAEEETALKRIKIIDRQPPPQQQHLYPQPEIHLPPLRLIPPLRHSPPRQFSPLPPSSHFYHPQPPHWAASPPSLGPPPPHGANPFPPRQEEFARQEQFARQERFAQEQHHHLDARESWDEYGRN